MKTLVRSLLAELFPNWVKEEVIQPKRRHMGARRTVARQQSPEGQHSPERVPSFGRRTNYRAGAATSRKSSAGKRR